MEVTWFVVAVVSTLLVLLVCIVAISICLCRRGLNTRSNNVQQQNTSYSRKHQLHAIIISFHFLSNQANFNPRRSTGFFFCSSSADVRVQRSNETRFHDDASRSGKLAPPCGPTRVPPQHAGPGPPLLPGKVKHASANGGDADLVSQSQKDEWFV